MLSNNDQKSTSNPLNEMHLKSYCFAITFLGKPGFYTPRRTDFDSEMGTSFVLETNSNNKTLALGEIKWDPKTQKDNQ